MVDGGTTYHLGGGRVVPGTTPGTTTGATTPPTTTL